MAESLKITARRLLELDRGLKQLDAIREDDKKVIALEFDAKTAYRLMRTGIAVEREVAVFARLDRQAAKDAGFFEGMAVSEENAKKADAYNRARADLLDQEIELEGAMLVSMDDLLNRPTEDPKTKKPLRNPVPMSVIARLAPIIQEESE